MKLRQQAIDPYRIKREQEASEYCKMGAEAGDDNCIEPDNKHMYKDIEEPIYKGETDENGLPHGDGTMDYAHGEYSHWLGYSIAPKSYRGQWCHGVKSGWGVMEYYFDGEYRRVRYAGNWADDTPNGKGELRVTLANGTDNSHVHVFEHGKREDWGVEIVDDVEIGCYWKSDRKNGRGICSLGYKKVFRGVWTDDVLDYSSCILAECDTTQTLVVELYCEASEQCIVALIPAKEGEYTTDNVLVIYSAGSVEAEPLLTIVKVEDGVVTYTCGDTLATISVGESATATIDSEGYIRRVNITFN